MIFQGLSFDYDLRVEGVETKNGEAIWIGRAVATRPTFEHLGLVGPRPAFELCGSCITLRPAAGWVAKFPVYWFADGPSREPQTAEELKAFPKVFPERELRSVSATIGETLSPVLQLGDVFRFKHDIGGGFFYHLVRNDALVLAAGAVGGQELEAGFLVTQEYEPEPDGPPPEPRFMDLGGVRLPIARLTARKPCITVRIEEQTFELADGQTASWDSRYVFLARSNNAVPYGFGAGPQAVFAAARLHGCLIEEVVERAARQMLRPKMQLL